MRRLLRSRPALGALALVLVSGAATTVFLRSSLATRSCGLVGGFSGVQVDVGLRFPVQQRQLHAFERRYVIRHRRFPARHNAFERKLVASLPVRRVAVCSAGRCRDIPLEAFLQDGLPGANVPTHGADPVDVSVVIDRRAQPPQLASGTVHPRGEEINGPGCGTDWNGSARVDGSVLRQIPD